MTDDSLPAVWPPLFTGSALVRYEGFDFELIPDGASRHREVLEQLRQPVLRIAACSRGWDRPEDFDHFGAVFKLDALFHANSLALIWRGDRLVGLAGLTYDLPVRDGVILHVGSLGLLPEAQNRGFLPVLFSLLWDAVWQHAELRRHIEEGRGYLTAITQSPFIMAFLAGVSSLHPAPGSGDPAPDFVEVAERVVGRFDPDVPFDRRTFVLRNECQFFYRRIPYSLDQGINELCDQRLRYGEGDTFMAVGQIRAHAVTRFVRAIEDGHSALFTALRKGLADLTYSWDRDSR
ncbi:MAG TPA: hypothetical protein VMV07_21905 [Streptosporangiaceae bacterium]|nr:hypothetical protein [Streptosporangiaceae bacterium]